MGYGWNTIRDFESYHRLVVAVDEDDLQLNLKQYKEIFVTNHLNPSLYTIEDPQNAVRLLDDNEGTPKIEYDDINMKAKRNLKRFGWTSGTFKFDKKAFSLH